MRLLVVTAVAAEQDAVARGLHTLDDEGEYRAAGHRLHRRGRPGGRLRADLLAAGVGPAASAAATATALTAAQARNQPYDLVVASGIGGGFAPQAPVGTVLVADRIIAADLGADSPDGFLPVEKLGFGTGVVSTPQPLTGAVARALGAMTGAVLTVSTATGTAERAEELARRWPDAAGEAMEGFGVAQAATGHGLPVLEIRAVSNPVGPRDRGAWRITEALAALTLAFTRLPRALEEQ